jgi:hypothetical protein
VRKANEAEVLDPWKGPEHLALQRERVLSFLETHTPVGD